ncbi:hypothetical protein PC120_g16140 [Phytophthora cactorum]|nr:hypothetical protein PC120_g16140 [Phytophthora cactorum]
MLPYIMKAKEDKLGIVLFDDIFKDSMSVSTAKKDKSHHVNDYTSVLITGSNGWRAEKVRRAGKERGGGM